MGSYLVKECADTLQNFGLETRVLRYHVYGPEVLWWKKERSNICRKIANAKLNKNLIDVWGMVIKQKFMYIDDCIGD